jgi:hypothetical protein
MSIQPTRHLWILALVAGCNFIYGLEDTSLNADRDDDGVLDNVDNCPAIANPDQLDTSTLDNGGDACAQCPLQSGIDLDSDNYDDGCDRCLGPGRPVGEPLLDIDDDDIDDRCDPCIGRTSSFEIDFNQNGIGDGCEVCFEPKGEDTDQDGLDDACDKCLAGPPHDEDGDGIEDGCDNCPFDSNPDQLPANALIGDRCSSQIGARIERSLFDPFLVRDNFRWPGVTGAWTIQGGRAALTGIGSRTISTRWSGEFRLITRAQLSGNNDATNVMISIVGSVASHQCIVHRTGQVTFAGESVQMSRTDQPITIELYHSDANLVRPMRCVVTAGTQSVELTAELVTGKLRITLSGLGPYALEGVDLLTALPTPRPL